MTQHMRLDVAVLLVGHWPCHRIWVVVQLLVTPAD